MDQQTGIIDVGGGLRSVYSAGIYDYLLDKNIEIDYCLGVSAGSANLISYVAKQRGRNVKFYLDYSFRKEYMGISNAIKKGSYFDFEYIYSTLSNSGGENPIDYDAFKKSKSKFVVVATNAANGAAHYFENKDVGQNNYDILKASCSLPAVCKPYEIGGTFNFDGGVADPVPHKKAFTDGCGKLVVVLTKPIDFIMPEQKRLPVVKQMLRKYPEIYREIAEKHKKYNRDVCELKKLEKAGKVLIISPAHCCGIETLTRNRQASRTLYDLGYKDAQKIEAFLT